VVQAEVARAAAERAEAAREVAAREAASLGNHANPSMDRRRELLPARRQLLLQIRHPLLRARRVLVRLSGVKGLGGRRRAQFARLCGRLACVSNPACSSEPARQNPKACSEQGVGWVSWTARSRGADHAPE
jgi:hypothetical protein